MNILLAALSPEEYQFVVGALLLTALISFYLFVRNWKRLRIIEDTPTAKLRSAHQGYIELKEKGNLLMTVRFTRRFRITHVSGIAV